MRIYPIVWLCYGLLMDGGQMHGLCKRGPSCQGLQTMDAQTSNKTHSSTVQTHQISSASPCFIYWSWWFLKRDPIGNSVSFNGFTGGFTVDLRNWTFRHFPIRTVGQVASERCYRGAMNGPHSGLSKLNFQWKWVHCLICYFKYIWYYRYNVPP